MATPIKQIQTIDNTAHDLDNRYIILNTSSGTLTNEQLSVLRASTENYILYSYGGMYCKYKNVIFDNPPGTTSGTMYYSYGDSFGRVQWCYINGTSYSFSTTAPDVRSDNSTSKLYLIGGESQSASGTTTHSNSSVYTTNGQLDANSIRIAENVSLVYNSTDKCLNFNFA